LIVAAEVAAGNKPEKNCDEGGALKQGIGIDQLILTQHLWQDCVFRGTEKGRLRGIGKEAEQHQRGRHQVKGQTGNQCKRDFGQTRGPDDPRFVEPVRQFTGYAGKQKKWKNVDRGSNHQGKICREPAKCHALEGDQKCKGALKGIIGEGSDPLGQEQRQERLVLEQG